MALPRWLLVLSLLAASVQAQDTGGGAGCLPRQEASDPAGDLTIAVTGRNVPPPPDSAPLDLLGVAMWRTGSGLAMSGTLAADPRADDTKQYYYWISFDAEQAAAGGNPATWTFQRTQTYDRIRTMYWDAGAEDYAVTWNGTTFSFEVPWEHFASQYAEWPMDIGSPRLSSTGPIAVGDPSGMTGYPEYVQATGGWHDFVSYDSDLVPLPACPAPAGVDATTAPPGAFEPGTPTSDNGTTSAPAPEAPGPAPLLLLAPLALAALGRRR